MLVSFFLCPAAFDGSSIDSKSARQAAQVLFNDILECGVVVDYRRRGTLSEVQARLELLPPQLKQRLLILLEELQKRHKVIVATPQDASVSTQAQLIQALRPDVAIVAKHSAAVDGVSESVDVGDYIDSGARRKKDRYRASLIPAARLDSIAVQHMVGTFLKYARSVCIIDKMIGRSAKDGRLARKYVDGLQFVVNCWKKHSVYARENLELVVVTVAGNTGAGAGFVNAAQVRSVIEGALGGLGVHLKLVLKEDSGRIFHARFIGARGRCLKLDPGVDALAGVGQSGSCLLIDSPTEADAAMAAEIMKLPELDMPAGRNCVQ